MMQQTLSLVDVLTPPENHWLKRISRSKANLPTGVRVVRFSDAGDDNSDAPYPAAVAFAPTASPGTQPRRRAAAGSAAR